MESLTRLPNLGPVLAEHLHRIGVDTPEPLRGMGSRAARIQIRKHQKLLKCGERLEHAVKTGLCTVNG